MASQRLGLSAPSVLHATEPADDTRTVAGAPKPPQSRNVGGRKKKAAAGKCSRDVALDFPETPCLSRVELDALERYLGAEIDRILDTRGGT